MPMHHWNPFSRERRLERKQLWIGSLMFYGAIMFFGGFVLSILIGFAVRDMPDSITKYWSVLPIIMVLGLVLYLVGLGYGMMSEKTQLKGPRVAKQNFRVAARYVITRDERMVTDESEIEFLDRPRYYVKLHHPQDGFFEYQCAPEVYFNCGEGMIGDAETQGSWLGTFRPYLGMEKTHVGERF